MAGRYHREFVAIVTPDDGTHVHAPDVAGNYATMCGMPSDDDESAGRPAPLPKRPKIDCRMCIAIIEQSKAYRTTDLAKDT